VPPNHASIATGNFQLDTIDPKPFVSVIMPIRNEAAYIEKTVGDLFKQDYPPDHLEILLVDGMSTDGTRETLARMLQDHQEVPVSVLDNPGQIVPIGLNIAIRHAQGEIIVRMDAHCEYPQDYVKRIVRLREETGADNAGGVLVPIGSSYTQRAICRAFHVPFSAGGALKGYHAQDKILEVDAVHGGCWRRQRLLEAGLFDEDMVRNQDDELSFRLRKMGGRVVQSQSILVRFHVRDSFCKLFLQFAQYGYWKVQVVRRHPRQASIRHVAPPLLLLILAGLGVLAPLGSMFLAGFVLFAGGYFSAATLGGLLEARRSQISLWLGIALATMLMHFGFGIGFLLGVLRLVLGPLPTDSVFKRLSR